MEISRQAIHFLLSLTILAGVAGAQSVTVSTTVDVIDIDPFSGTVADLPGPDGLVSFSEAMIATNNTPGHQTVGFAIPASQLGWCCPQYDGIAVFHSNVGFYWRANDEVTVDGTTQTTFAGNTNPDGAEVLLYGRTFYLNDSNSTLRGFHGTEVQSGGSNNLFEGNTGGMNLTLFGGGGSTVRNNDCGTIKIDRSNSNVVIRNQMTRVRVLGGGSSQPAMNNRIGGATLGERNLITGYGFVNSQGLPSGAAVQLAWTRGTHIENNRIGTTPDGLAQGNTACTMGINLQTENHDVLVRGNLIAGILGRGQGPHHAGQLFGWAIYFWGSTSNILIEGNTIGLDAHGDPTLGSVWGVNVDNFSGYTVDGVRLADNAIAGHILNGVRVGPTATMRLTGNSIHDNGWLGIDLIPSNFQSGVSPNDPLDTDSGGNGVQNYPELTSATVSGGLVRAIGTLHSSALDTFTLEFFASSACHPDGHGEGELFLGAAQVSTDAAGGAAFDVLLPVTAPQGWIVSATATHEAMGATSEFSACVPLTVGPGIAVCQGDTACPCGNNSASASSSGCLNSTGAGAALRGLGSSSVTADDLVLTVTHLPSHSAGLLFMGQNPAAPSPVGDGLLCIGAPLYRFVVQGADPSGTATYGPGLVDFGMLNHPQSAWIASGATWTFQCWYRDVSGPCGNAYSLSSGLEVTFTP